MQLGRVAQRRNHLVRGGITLREGPVLAYSHTYIHTYIHIEGMHLQQDIGSVSIENQESYAEVQDFEESQQPQRVRGLFKKRKQYASRYNFAS